MGVVTIASAVAAVLVSLWSVVLAVVNIVVLAGVAIVLPDDVSLLLSCSDEKQQPTIIELSH